MRALSSKADKETTLNSIRLKADAVEISSALSTKADLTETRDLLNRNQTQISSVVRDLTDLRQEFRVEVGRMADKVKRKVDMDEVEGLKLACATGADWRGAVTDVSVNLRREISDKAGREEMVQMVRREVDGLKAGIFEVEKAMEEKADGEASMQVSSNLEVLTRKFAEAHSSGRWLWRSGKLLRGGAIPWEVQVNNAAPQSLLWKTDSDIITCTAPGLYEVTVGVFTQNPAGVDLCMNGEPIVTMEPTDVGGGGGGGGGGGVLVKENTGLEHIKKRHRHSAGDITSVAINEIVALPPNATISVRFDSSTRAQGFLSVRKM